MLWQPRVITELCPLRAHRGASFVEEPRLPVLRGLRPFVHRGNRSRERVRHYQVFHDFCLNLDDLHFSCVNPESDLEVTRLLWSALTVPCSFLRSASITYTSPPSSRCLPFPPRSK